MNESYLLDTAIAMLAARRDPPIVAQLATARDVYVPEIVHGELFYGAYRYARLHTSTTFLDLVEDLVKRSEYKLLTSDLDTARTCGPIHAELEAKGQIIQTNDMWIAALARQHGLTLLTRDGDFARVARLSFEVV